MGLDITLGIIVLIAAVRGWFKGFLKQAIPLGALVACVYLADPLRDLGRPYGPKYFPKIAPEVMDRLLWWSGSAISYVAITGLGLWIVKSMKKRTYGDPEPNRADQGAGFTLGVAKGLILASFLAAGVSRYAPTYLVTPFVDEQARTSRALSWSVEYRPAERLWHSPPVQTWIARVKTRGMWGETAGEGVKTPAPREVARPESAAETPVRTASGKPRTMSLPPRLDPDSPEFLRQLREDMRREGLDPDRP